MRASWLFLLAACAGHPVLYDVENVRGPYGTPGTGAIDRAAGHCDAKLRIRVIDQAFRPVVGARVIVSRRVTAMAIEENLGVSAFTTHPVLTDKHGFAHVCSPDDLPPRSPWEGIGGGFTMRDRAQLDVFDDHGRAATMHEPFVMQIMLRDRS